MNRALPLLALLALSCGEPISGVGLPLAIDLKGFTETEAGAVQITVLANGDRYSCDTLRRTCLSKQIFIDEDNVSEADLVPVRDGEDGEEKRSFRRMLKLQALESADGQTFDLFVPPGENYLVMVEILTADGPRLIASGCAAVARLQEGDNPEVQVAPTMLASASTCDPRID